MIQSFTIGCTLMQLAGYLNILIGFYPLIVSWMARETTAFYKLGLVLGGLSIGYGLGVLFMEHSKL